MSTERLAADAERYDEDRAEAMKDTRDDAVFAVKRALGWTEDGDSLIPPQPASGGEGLARGDNARDTRLRPDDVTREIVMNVRTAAATEEHSRLRAISRRVEIHKKYAISIVCIVFVLIGAPLAVRFPRGGVGMVITASVAIFSLFWVFLIGGETLADRGYMGPGMSMWMPNLLLFPVGILLLSRMSRHVATARGGGWDDLLNTVSEVARKPIRKLAGSHDA
jgi:hypothetical protein